jgi:hypothetical protein
VISLGCGHEVVESIGYAALAAKYTSNDGRDTQNFSSAPNEMQILHSNDFSLLDFLLVGCAWPVSQLIIVQPCGRHVTSLHIILGELILASDNHVL